MLKSFKPLLIFASFLVQLNVFAQQAPGSSFGFKNPVITGMNPDPSICKAGDDYYLVTSTFLWFPGVPVYHSKDLIHWELKGYCLNRKSQLDLSTGSGIYAPAIRYHKGVFYVITTNQRNGGNFIVTASNPAGPWSDPIWVKELSGIDPSLFFDEDGKVYFTSTHPDGIVQAEIDVKTGKTLGPQKIIWQGTGGRYPEGPHMYKISGLYYLMISEGGTEYGHNVVIARSTNPWGPFEANPANPILTHRNKNAQSNIIQGTGHADFVQGTDGSWWMVFLAFRQQGSHHHIGRETFLAPVRWDTNSWPLVNTTGTADLQMNVPTLPQTAVKKPENREEFNSSNLPLHWNFIRNPDMGAYSLTERKGWLAIKGSESSLSAGMQPSFAGFRQTDLTFSAEAHLQFNPAAETDEAGLSVYHRPNGHYDVFIRKENNQKLAILRYTLGSLVHEEAKVKLRGETAYLRAEGTAQTYTFSFSEDGKSYQKLGSIETRFLSSETLGGFTGTFLGLYASGNGKKTSSPAYFDWLEYSGKD